MLIVSLVLHQVKEVGATSKESNPECTTLAYIGIILTICSYITENQDFINATGFQMQKQL